MRGQTVIYVYCPFATGRGNFLLTEVVNEHHFYEFTQPDVYI